MVNTTKPMAIACVMGALVLGSSSSFAYTADCPSVVPLDVSLNGCDLPETVAGSFPYFDNVVAVTASTKNDGTAKLQAKGYKGSLSNYLVLSPTDIIPVEKMKYDLQAQVKGGELTGNVKVSGKINGEKISMTADLSGAGDTGFANTLLGFDTTNMECKGPEEFTSLCSTGEVVYLNLLEGIDFEPGTKVSTAGRALTSIPVPAAAWLFGSGLVGLIAVSRRRGDKA
jgi:hypothetical protein